MREFLSVEQLAALTPWTPSAIRSMVARGTFKRGIHYFQPGGVRGQLIFRWSAVVSYIEGQVRDRPEAEGGSVIRFADGSTINVDEAANTILRLHR